MGQWIKERIVNVLIYGTIILGIGFFLYSAFLKPTNSEKTTNNADKILYNQWWKDARIEVGPLGCATFKAEKQPQGKQ